MLMRKTLQGWKKKEIMRKIISIAIIMLTMCVTNIAAQEKGIASYYGLKANRRNTSSGERHDSYDLVCAHKKYPMGTKLKVTNLKNGKSVVVRVNDRGPYARGWIVDLSWRAAKEIGILAQGVAKVIVEVIKDEKEKVNKKQ